MSASSLEITTCPVKGRCYVAARAIEKGEMLLKSRPLVVVPDFFSTHSICYQCVYPPDLPVEPLAKRTQLQVTCPVHPSCRLVSYCSTGCAARDAAIHALECAIFRSDDDLFQKFRNLDDYVQDYTRLIARLFIQTSVKREPLDAFWNLCDNFGAWPLDRINGFIVPAMVLEHVVNQLKEFSFPLIDREQYQAQLDAWGLGQVSQTFLACLISIMKEENNSFGLYTYAYLGNDHPRQSYAMGVFPDAIYFNHSCNPCTKHVYLPDSSIAFFATEDIPQGKEVTISYLGAGTHNLAYKVRQETLKNYFLFDCMCDCCLEQSTQQK